MCSGLAECLWVDLLSIVEFLLHSSHSHMFRPGLQLYIILKMYERRRNHFDYGWLDEVAINRGNCGGAWAGSIRFNQNTRPLMRVGGMRPKVTA